MDLEVADGEAACVLEGLVLRDVFEEISCCAGTSSNASGSAALSTIGVDVLMFLRKVKAGLATWKSV